jgi:membrane-bound metal-dependent hydrolase YbcI (DUF457 family)
MLYTPHFLTGAAIIKIIPNPAIGLPLALLSHVALDMLPHHDFEVRPGMNIQDILNRGEKRTYFLLIAVGLDAILLLFSFIWLFITKNNYLMLLGGIIAILPDVVEQGLLVLGKRLPAIQDKFQNRVSAKWGFISYPIVSLIALYILR